MKSLLTVFLMTIPTASVYVVLRSVAIDDGDSLDRAATMFVAAMLTMVWLKYLFKE
jgi:hypothetical protein